MLIFFKRYAHSASTAKLSYASAQKPRKSLSVSAEGAHPVSCISPGFYFSPEQANQTLGLETYSSGGSFPSQ